MTRPLREEQVVPLVRRLPHVLFFRGYAARCPNQRLAMAVIQRRARWSGRVVTWLAAAVPQKAGAR